METSRVVQIPRFGGPEVFKLTDIPTTRIFPKGVRIRVSASGVNFADLMMRMGMYPEAPPLPFVPGYEVAGTVTEVGSEVKNVRVGDRVVAGTKFGGYSTEVVVSEHQAHKIPAGISETQAAAIPVNFITAWLALHELARIRKGDRVLVPSAAGGVGVAAVQLAARAGARVTGLVGSPSKAEVVKRLGASEVITNKDWESGSDQELGGYDLILDATNGASLKRAFRRLASGGRVVEYGAAMMVDGKRRSYLRAARFLLTTPIFHPVQLMNANKGVFGLNVLKLFEPEGSEVMNRGFEQILGGLERGELEVLIGKTFPLAEAGAAQAHLQSRANVGKVVLTID